MRESPIRHNKLTHLDVKAQVIANAQVIVNAQVKASLRQRGVVVTKLESTRNLHYSTGVGQVFQSIRSIPLSSTTWAADFCRFSTGLLTSSLANSSKPLLGPLEFASAGKIKAGASALAELALDQYLVLWLQGSLCYEMVHLN
jgi:hypothetical protein